MLKSLLTAGASALMLAAAPVAAQQKEIRIGVIYDLTGPFAGGGSEANHIGTIELHRQARGQHSQIEPPA